MFESRFDIERSDKWFASIINDTNKKKEKKDFYIK